MRRHHLRLGHLRPELMAKLIANRKLKDIPGLDERSALANLSDNMKCLLCKEHKTARRSYTGMMGARSTIKCHTLHVDTKGPLSSALTLPMGINTY